MLTFNHQAFQSWLKEAAVLNELSRLAHPRFFSSSNTTSKSLKSQVGSTCDEQIVHLWSVRESRTSYLLCPAFDFHQWTYVHPFTSQSLKQSWSLADSLLLGHKKHSIESWHLVFNCLSLCQFSHPKDFSKFRKNFLSC